MSSTGLHSVPNRQPVLSQPFAQRPAEGLPGWLRVELLEQRWLLAIFRALTRSGNHIANPP
jgi:hypothetical protein